jgi:CHC2 zinc finger
LHGWIAAPNQRRIRRGELGTNEYFFLNPITGQRLQTLPVKPYFIVPACIVRKQEMHWSLRSMGRADVALYATLLFKANQARKNTFANNHALLLKMSSLSRGTNGTYSKAIESLQRKRLIRVDEENITLCDPLTGEPPALALDAENDPANYYDSLTGRRITFNIENPEELLRWVRDSLPNGADVIPENNDEYKIRCPYHADPNPSLNFNLGKNTFHCFGCGEKGTIRKLVKELTCTSESESIQQQALALGYKPAFEPNSQAEAEYRYTDQSGEMLYRVLRLPGKQFSQQRWAQGEWVHRLNGVKRTLYNLPEIDCAATIIVTEGEKDADRVNQLRLTDFTGRRVVATTSGGADSWEDKFADLLTGPCYRIPAHLPMVDKRRLVVMPDSDEPGQRYKDRILQSLDTRTIPYCVVTFDGFKDVSDYLDAGHTGAELARRITDELSKIGAGAVTFAESVPEQLEEITI